MANSIQDIDRNMKILIVDDFATMRKIVKTLFVRLGFHKITEAEDGAEALAKLKADSFDFIVSDWNMPKMMGLDLLKAVRADQSLKDIPFLMITAESQKENVVQAVQAGVSNYVVKPFNQEVVETKLLQIFKNK